MSAAEPSRLADVAAERAALGAILLCSAVAGNALPLLREDDFFRPWHGALLRVLHDMHAGGCHIDPVTVHAVLRRRNLGRLGVQHNSGLLLSELIEAPPVPAAGMSYVRIVLEYAARRRVAEAGVRLIQLAESGQRDLPELAQWVDREVAAVHLAVARHEGLESPVHEIFALPSVRDEPGRAGRGVRSSRE